MIYEHTTVCPKCGGTLRYYNKARRIVRTGNGVTHWITIKRMICCSCGSTHRELPGYLLPYKHYTAVIFYGFISGELSPFDLEYEDYPSETTVKRWKRERAL